MKDYKILNSCANCYFCKYSIVIEGYYCNYDNNVPESFLYNSKEKSLETLEQEYDWVQTYAVSSNGICRDYEKIELPF
jgi:hypothetical protein